MPEQIKVRGARVRSLKNIDADVTLNQIVAIAGVSGSGKSSLALGVLYAEGSRRYLEALSTYTRRRMIQAAARDNAALFIHFFEALRRKTGGGLGCVGAAFPDSCCGYCPCESARNVIQWDQIIEGSVCHESSAGANQKQKKYP